MILALILDEVVSLVEIDDKIYDERLFRLNNKEYYKIESPSSFELGFYNWIISNEQIVGICYRFNDGKFLEKIFDKNRNNLSINDNEELCIDFQKLNSDSWTYYIEGFTALFLLESKEGNYALTFEISNDSEYKIAQESIQERFT